MTTTVSEGIVKLSGLMICFLPLYSVGRVLWLKRSTAEGYVCRAREIILALFVLFMCGLLILTFESQGVVWLDANIFRRAGERLSTGLGVNFVPFRTIRNYLKYSPDFGGIVVNIIGNIVMFLPWGMGLCLLWKKNQSFLKLTYMSLVLPVFIEFVQLFIGRSVDVDDVILNFTGGMLGGLSYLVLVKLFPGLKKLAR